MLPQLLQCKTLNQCTTNPADEESPPELQQSESLTQQQPSQVSFDDDQVESQRQAPSRQLSTAESVQSQTAPSPRQLSASGSTLSQIAESPSEQPGVDSAELSQIAEADEPTENAEDDYGDEFEMDEFAVDDSAEPRAAASASLRTYDNHLGNDESAEEAEEQEAQPIQSAPDSAWSYEAHVAPHLTVSDNGSVKLHCELETENQSLRNDDIGANSAGNLVGTYGASSHVPHVTTQLRVPEGEAGKVQWSLDVSRPEPDEDAEEEEDEDEKDRAKGKVSKMPSTPHPRRSIFSAARNMADDVDEDAEEEEDEDEDDKGGAKARFSKMPSTSHPSRSIFIASGNMADDVPDEDAEEDDDKDDDDQGRAKGRFSKIPSTPHPRRSIFSASGNMADDVDAFSMTQPDDDSASDAAASDLEPDFGGSLHRLSSDGKQASEMESGMELTPSYRRLEGRSLQQAADNEQPFASSWRPQPAAAEEADSVSTHGMERVTEGSIQQPSELEGHQSAMREVANSTLPPAKLEPISASQTPLRLLSLRKEDPLAVGNLQSGGDAAGLSVPANQPSFNKATAEALPAKMPSQTSLPVQFSLDKLGSGSLSTQPSYLNVPLSGANSRWSSFSARIERETSQLFAPSQLSGADVQNGSDLPSKVVSRTASLTGSTNPLLSPELSSRSMASNAAADQSLSSKPAELGRQSSQISRQPSGGKPAAAAAAAAAAAPSAVGSWGVSRQTSLTDSLAAPQTKQFGRQSSQSHAAAAVAASPVASRVASRVVSRQPSLTQPPALSRQASQVSRQANSSSVAAAASPSGMPSKAPSRQLSLNRPGSASRQNSQLLQLQADGGNSTPSRPSSKVPSRQQSLASSGYPGQANVPDSLELSQHASQPLPASRSYSMSSQPWRSNSLEVLHRQMSTPRNATTVDQVAPAVAKEKMSQDREGTTKL